MKILTVIILSLAFLTSCDNTPPKQKGADGYYFEKETFVRTEFPVEVVLVQSEKEMASLLSKKANLIAGDISPKEAAAFAVIRTNDTKCTLYILDPKVKYQPEYIGHEFVHCIYGVWHSEPQV